MPGSTIPCNHSVVLPSTPLQHKMAVYLTRTERWDTRTFGYQQYNSSKQQRQLKKFQGQIRHYILQYCYFDTLARDYTFVSIFRTWKVHYRPSITKTMAQITTFARLYSLYSRDTNRRFL